MSQRAEKTGAPPALLLEPGPRAREARLRLAVMIGLSLLGHAVSFYVLQVFYAPAVALPPSPPPARWTVLPAGSPENAALQRWLSVADPALSAGAPAPPAERVLAEVPPARYPPSFVANAFTGRFAPPLPAPALPPETGADAVRRALPPGPAPAPGRPPDSPPPAGAAPTRLVFAETLRARLPADGALAPVPLAHRASAAAELLRPAVFLVGARPEGGEPLVFREESTGVAAADEAAREYLRALPFSPSPNGGSAWGRVTVFWGREVYR